MAPRPLTGTAPRACGPCSACCTTAPVVPLQKPAGVACQHRQPGAVPACGSCRIYAERPSCCAQYRCAWLDGHGHENDRPDACGYVTELATDGDGNTRLAFLCPSPGFEEDAPGFRSAVAEWRVAGVVVFTPRGVVASREVIRELLLSRFVFADGIEAQFMEDTEEGT